jgi:kojibiose phosphorylase
MSPARLLATAESGWSVEQRSWSSGDEGDWETRFCLANGYAGVRGSLSLASASRDPATFLAGAFDKPDTQDTSGVFGLSLQNKARTPSFAVAPRWNLLELAVNGEPLDFLNARPVAFRRLLDLRRGLLLQEYALQDRAGQRTTVREAALLSIVRRHVWMTILEIEGDDRVAVADVRAAIDLWPGPADIPRLRDFTCRTDIGERGERGGAAFLEARVAETGTAIAVASRLAAEVPTSVELRPRGVAERVQLPLRPGTPQRLVRIVTVATSRESADAPGLASAELARALEAGPDALLDEHCGRWAELWEDADVAFDGDDRTQRGVRFCIFSLLQMANPDDPDVSVAATGLHGQGYFGHVFWDTEIFLLPFYLAVLPRAADSLLRYRGNRLDAARANAKAAGAPGAKFPWTSTSTGRDVTPPDWQRCADRQIHISGDVAWAFANHRRWTGDDGFFLGAGVEVIVETARYFLSKLSGGADGRFHILDVLGPDEYHLHANDNYYTNHLARWNFLAAVAGMEELAARDPSTFGVVAGRTGWSSALADRLREAAAAMAFPRTRDGVCEQYEGFFDLPDIGALPRGDFNIPRVADHFYDTETQVSKQADVPMLHYLFPEDFPAAVVRATYDYYDRRCSQASSLSPSVFAIVGTRAGRDDHAYGYFQLTALLDLENLHMDRNLPQGIHAACAGGTWCAAVLGFGGVSVKGDTLCIDPRLPTRWSGLRFSLRFRGRHLRVRAVPGEVTVALRGEPLSLVLPGGRVTVREGADARAVIRRGP